MTLDPVLSFAPQNGLAETTTQKTTQADGPSKSYTNPFDVIRDDLGLLASGHELILEEGTSGQQVQGKRIGGKEWERLVGRLKGFLRESNENIFQVSLNDPTVQPKPTARKRARSPTPTITSSLPSILNGSTKRARVSSISTGGDVIERGHAGLGRIRDGHHSIVVPLSFREKVLPGSSSAKTVDDGTPSKGEEAMWKDRQTLVETVQHIQTGLNDWIQFESGSAATTGHLIMGTMMTNGSAVKVPNGPPAGLREETKKDTPREVAVRKVMEAGGIELRVSDYWSGRHPHNEPERSREKYSGGHDNIAGSLGSQQSQLKSTSDNLEINGRISQSASDPSRSPEFGLSFRLPGVIRGYVVFGPRKRRRRRRRMTSSGSVDVDGGVEMGLEKKKEKEDERAFAGGVIGDEKGDEKMRMMMLAIRFNVFADTESTKGKNDVSNYKTMVDLSRYLNLMELGFEETLFHLSSYIDLMTTPCALCGRLQSQTNGSLAFGRERVSSGTGWRSFHLDCSALGGG